MTLCPVTELIIQQINNTQLRVHDDDDDDEGCLESHARGASTAVKASYGVLVLVPHDCNHKRVNHDSDLLTVFTLIILKY